MILEKIATIGSDRMEVLVPVGSTGIELQRSLNDALMLIQRRDGMQGNVDKAEKDRVSMDRREDVMINGGNEFFEMTRVLSLLQVNEERFTEMMDTFQIEPLIDVNGSKFIDRNILAIISRYKRERSEWD